MWLGLSSPNKAFAVVEYAALTAAAVSKSFSVCSGGFEPEWACAAEEAVAVGCGIVGAVGRRVAVERRGASAVHAM